MRILQLWAWKSVQDNIPLSSRGQSATHICKAGDKRERGRLSHKEPQCSAFQLHGTNSLHHRLPATFSPRPAPKLVFSKTICSTPAVEMASSLLSLIWLLVHSSSLLSNKPPGDAVRGYALHTAQPGRMIIALLTAPCTRQPPKQRKHELKQDKKEGLYPLPNKVLFMLLESFLAER